MLGVGSTLEDEQRDHRVRYLYAKLVNDLHTALKAQALKKEHLGHKEKKSKPCLDLTLISFIGGPWHAKADLVRG